jgi:hypothetical protein
MVVRTERERYVLGGCIIGVAAKPWDFTPRIYHM